MIYNILCCERLSKGIMLELLDIQSISVVCFSYNTLFERASFHMPTLELHSNKLFISDMYIYRVSVTH